MLYRILRHVNEWYALTIFWLYVGAFLCSFWLIFVFPPAPLLMVFLGLGGLGFAVIGARILRASLQCVARYSINHGVCPRCRASIQTRPAPAQPWRCASCGTDFGPKGDELPPMPLTATDNATIE